MSRPGPADSRLSVWHTLVNCHVQGEERDVQAGKKPAALSPAPSLVSLWTGWEHTTSTWIDFHYPEGGTENPSHTQLTGHLGDLAQGLRTITREPCSRGKPRLTLAELLTHLQHISIHTRKSLSRPPLYLLASPTDSLHLLHTRCWLRTISYSKLLFETDSVGQGLCKLHVEIHECIMKTI